MKQIWSITESIYVYYSYDDNRVFLANPEAKKFYGPVKKIAESTKDPEIIKNEGFSIKFCNERVKICISGKWYTIGNVFTQEIISQLSSATMKDGEVTGVVFGFNPVFPDQVLPLFPGSELHNNAEKEFIRKINLSLYSKTTKYKPGHKYENDIGTYIYLGEVISHKPDRSNSKRFTVSNSGVRKLHAFINDIPENLKYEEIMSGYVIKELYDYPNEIKEKTIFLVSKNKSMADVGEVMNISGNFEDSWETRIKNYVTNKKRPFSYKSNLYHYSDFDNLVTVFNVSMDLVPRVTEDSKNLMKKIIETEYRYYLYKFYDVPAQSANLNILAKKDKETQIENLVNTLIENGIRDTQNYYDKDYYRELFKVLFDINLSEMAETSLDSFKLLTISVSDYNDLIDNFRYLEYREPENYIKTINFVYINDGKRSFDTFFKDGMYKDVIKDIYTKALQDNGSELKEFAVTNVGTTRSPELQYSFSITLEDLEKYFGVKDVHDFPEAFKQELINNKIYKINIVTRDNIKVKL